MSDFASELPVRTQNNGDVVIRLVDGSSTTQFAAVDSTGHLSVLSDSEAALSAGQSTAAAPAVALDVAGVYNTPRLTLTNGHAAPVQLDSAGNLYVSIADSVSLAVTGTFWQATQPVSIATMPTTPVTGTFWQTTQPISLASGSVASGAFASGALSSGSIASGALASGAISAGAVAAGAFVSGSVLSGAFASGAITQLPTSLGAQAIGSSLSVTPATSSVWPVSISASATGTQIYHSTMVGSTAVATNGTATNTYTVTALKTLSLTQLVASASGKIKVVVTAPANATPLIGTFFNSTANPNVCFDLDAAPIAVAAGDTVVVTITNLDNQAQDVYSTIVGLEN